jgi:hypothetical protein
MAGIWASVFNCALWREMIGKVEGKILLFGMSCLEVFCGERGVAFWLNCE